MFNNNNHIPGVFIPYNSNNNNNSNQNNGNLSQFDLDLKKALELSRKTYELEQKKDIQLNNKIINSNDNVKPRNKLSKNVLPYKKFLDNLNWKKMYINRGIGSGLQNLGNSCFMNATLQCLMYTPVFAQLLMQGYHSLKCKSKKFCVLCELEKLIPPVLTGKQIQRPYTMFKNLGKVNDLLTPGCQEDAHEFWTSLLDKIEIAYDNAGDNLNKNNKCFDKYNPIRSLFTGEMKTTIQCGKCRKYSISKEPYCCLSLDVDDIDTLPESLSVLTQDEVLKGNNKYYCNNCKRKCIAHKKITLSKIPNILVLHLKRFAIQQFSVHHKQNHATKVTSKVEYNFEIDFNKYKDLLDPNNIDNILRDSKYELYAVLIHNGPKLGYGHYYSLVKSPNGKWFRMNDTHVDIIKYKDVLNEQGYLLFYRCKTANFLKESIINDNNIISSNNGNSNIDIDSNNENESKDDMEISDENSSPKVNDNINQDYFKSNCIGDSDDDNILMVNQNNKQNINNNNTDNDGNALDRIHYIKIPGLATRPKLNKNKKNTTFEEVFWPQNYNESDSSNNDDSTVDVE